MLIWKFDAAQLLVARTRTLSLYKNLEHFAITGEGGGCGSAIAGTGVTKSVKLKGYLPEAIMFGSSVGRGPNRTVKSIRMCFTDWKVA